MCNMWREASLAMLMMWLVLASATNVALHQTSLLYGLTDAVSGRFNSSTTDVCWRQLDALRRGIHGRELWALKMLDSSGVPGSGFLWGNNYWLGSRSQCMDAANRSPLVLANNTLKPPLPTPPFSVRFLVAELRVNASIQVHVDMPGEDLLMVGLCVPGSCSPETISPLLSQLLFTQPLQMQQVYGATLRLESVRTLEEDNSWLTQPSFLIIASVLGAVLLLMLAGTLYDTVLWQSHLRRSDRQLNNHKIDKDRVEIMMTNNLKGALAQLEAKLKSPNCDEKKKRYQQGALGRFLLCFSIYSNTSILLDTRLGADSVGAVHGLRFMGMGWILMVHTVFYLSDVADNKPQAFRLAEGFMVQVISNSTLSVDTFFFLSGFLVSYLFYKAKQGKELLQPSLGSRVQEFGLMVLRRFIRLTPAYMAVVGIVVVNQTWYSHTSLFHMTERADVVCAQHWWRNLLYINNLFGRDEMCLSWSWYLSNDMQFFVIAAFLLVLSTTCFMLSASILLALVMLSSLFTGYMSYSYSYVPTLDQQLAMLGVLYDPPWARIGPHLVGVATGWMVVKLNGELSLSKFTVTCGWLLGMACNVSVLFGLYERNISPLTAAVYVALSRTAWGVGLAWIIVACCTNNAGFINTILSFKAWVPLSRLTYCAYLVNPMLMTSVYLSGEMAAHIDFLPLAATFLGHVGICYFCAYAVSLAFETPNVLLLRWLVERKSNRKSTHT